MPSETLRHPPFPEMTWTDCDWWEGTACLPAWAGFQSRGGTFGSMDSDALSDGTASINLTPHNPDVSRLPSDVQCSAFSFQRENGDVAVASVLAALPAYYNRLRPQWEAHYDAETLHRIMPPITAQTNFKTLIGLSQIHVHPWKKAGVSYIGLEFGCTWDREHGFGVMLHNSRVVDLGSADVSFAWKPKEADRI